MTIELKDKLYTSTEVANVLGVSLRSVYRYLDEGKLHADVKTATGRHRFSKQNILNFLYPQETKDIEIQDKATPSKPNQARKRVETPIVEEDIQTTLTEDEKKYDIPTDEENMPEEETNDIVEEDGVEEDSAVDWLAKFRAAAERYRAEQATKQEDIAPNDSIIDHTHSTTQQTRSIDIDNDDIEQQEQEIEEKTEYYYLSGVGGLKEIAQSLDKAAKKASVDYAFTLDAGLSLFKPIRPFSLINAYVRSSDRDYFEKALKLTEVSKSSAQLCLHISDENSIYRDKREMYGLNVVSRDKLRMDLVAAGEKDLVSELDTIA